MRRRGGKLNLDGELAILGHTLRVGPPLLSELGLHLLRDVLDERLTLELRRPNALRLRLRRHQYKQGGEARKVRTAAGKGAE